MSLWIVAVKAQSYVAGCKASPSFQLLEKGLAAQGRNSVLGSPRANGLPHARHEPVSYFTSIGFVSGQLCTQHPILLPRPNHKKYGDPGPRQQGPPRAQRKRD